MQVVFRTDASRRIGTGHVMRCLVLAAELRDRGAQCRFVCRDHVGHLAAHIRKAGFDVALISRTDAKPAPNDSDPAHADWLGTDWQTDARQFIAASGARPIDCVVIDHYSLDQRWELEVKSCCASTAVIDDLADRKHDCDILLDQNPGRQDSEYRGLVPPTCRILAGPRYALLRREFALWRARSLQRNRSFPPAEIVVSLGGVDADNMTSVVLQALEAAPLPPTTQVTVVLGAGSPHVAAVQRLVRNLRLSARLEIDTERMAELLTAADLVIGAAGTSALERCCLGVPSLCVVLAANQQSGAAALESQGAAKILPAQIGALETTLVDLWRHAQPRDFLRRMQDAAQSLTDGLGARRVADAILP